MTCPKSDIVPKKRYLRSGVKIYYRIFYILPASESYKLPMFIMLLHLSFDQVSHELSKGRLVISFVTIFTQVPSSCNTNVSAVFRNKLILNPGVSLELVPVGRARFSTQC